MDTLSGKKYGQGLNAIPSRKKAFEMVKSLEYQPVDENRKEREMIIYRSFNMEKVNL